MLEELSELVTGAYQQVGVAVHVDDQVNGLKEDCVLGVGVLYFLRLRGLLGLVQYGL